MHILTKGELHDLSKRIDQILETFELCDPDRDFDVIQTLTNELTEIEQTIETSLYNLRRSKLKLIA